MCGMDVDLDDGGSAEEEKEEEFWIGEGVKMLPPPVAHSGGSAWGSRRGRCGCVACGAALIFWNLCVVLASALLLAVVFSVVLLPAMLLLYVGFLCHSRVSCLQHCVVLSTGVNLLFILFLARTRCEEKFIVIQVDIWFDLRYKSQVDKLHLNKSGLWMNSQRMLVGGKQHRL